MENMIGIIAEQMLKHATAMSKIKTSLDEIIAMLLWKMREIRNMGAGEYKIIEAYFA